MSNHVFLHFSHPAVTENTSFCRLLIFVPLHISLQVLGSTGPAMTECLGLLAVDNNRNSMQNAKNIQQYYRVLIICGVGVIIIRTLFT